MDRHFFELVMYGNGDSNHSPFIVPNDLSVSQSDLDTLRRMSSENLSQSQLTELRKLVLNLKVTLIEKQTKFKDQFEKFTKTDLFRQAVEYALRSQQHPIAMEIKPPMAPPVPMPVEVKPKPQPKYSKNDGASKRPRGNNKEIKQDKPKRQNSQKPEKPKEIKRIDLTNDKPIWGMTDIFLNPIPNDNDLKNLLEVTLQDQQEIVPEEHWSQRLSKIVTAPREGRARAQIKLPPAPPPGDDEVNEYWIEHVPSFQIEDQQMINSGIIHRLLSSFVCSAPLEPKKQKKKPFLRINPLPPKIPYNHYFSLSYDQRLLLELKSLGLSSENCVQMNTSDGPFITELDSYREKLAEIKPKLESYYQQICSELTDMRRKEQNRLRMNSAFVQLVQEYNSHATK